MSTVKQTFISTGSGPHPHTFAAVKATTPKAFDGSTGIVSHVLVIKVGSVKNLLP